MLSVAPWLCAIASAAWPELDEPLRTDARAEGDAAVVIGIEDYAFLGDVPHAERDARAIYDFLVSTRGVPAERVRLMDAASREQIAAAVQEAARQVGPEGTLWFYFAGHGVAAPSSGQRLLLADDARQDPTVFESRGITLDEIETLASKGGSHVALIVDACFNGANRSGDDLVAGTRFAVPIWTADPSPSVLRWSAAGPDELARPLPVARHGAFTALLLGALRGWADGERDGTRDGIVTAEEAQLFVARKLPQIGIEDQRPVLTVEGADRWVLARGVDEEVPSLSSDAEMVVSRPPSVADRSAHASLNFHPDLLATADAHGVALPLHKTVFGYKDSEDDLVDKHTYTALVRSTRRGRSAYTRLYSGVALVAVGSVTAIGSFGAGVVFESPGYVWGGALGAAGTLGGIVLLGSSRAGIAHALDPMPVSALPDAP